MTQICNSSSECFDETTGVQKFCYKNREPFNNNTNCECSLFLGWIGPECDELSPVVHYNRVVYIFLLIWTSILIILSVRTLLLNLIAVENLTSLLEATMIAVVSNFMTVALFFIAFILRIPAFFDSTYVQITPVKSLIFGSFDVVVEKNNNVRIIVLFLGIWGLNTTIILVLLGMNNFMFTVSRFATSFVTRSVNCWDRILKFATLVYLVLVILVIKLKLYADSVAIAGFIAVLAGLSSPILCFRFLRMIEEFGKNSRSVQESTWLIKRFVIILTALLQCFAIVQMLFYIVLNILDDDADIGKIPGSLVLADLLNVICCLLISVIAWYLNSATEGAIVADFYPSCGRIFFWWDYQNKNVIPVEEFSVTNSMAEI